MLLIKKLEKSGTLLLHLTLLVITKKAEITSLWNKGG